MLFLLKLSYRFNIILIIILVAAFVEIKNLSLKRMWKLKG